MTADADVDPSAPLYCIVERRQSDGALRIVGEYPDVRDALAACRLMRWAGAASWCVLITAILDEAKP